MKTEARANVGAYAVLAGLTPTLLGALLGWSLGYVVLLSVSFASSGAVVAALQAIDDMRAAAHDG
ncbi:hypothetical protein [Microbacterium testaceum]|uniref:hypothetical protein n=1 Tax=Microbacterium testaceum TaxID=2033 RepID=UPI002435FB7C|nr:hypothetical protein [Microbacterium testaceum]